MPVETALGLTISSGSLTVTVILGILAVVNSNQKK